MIAINAAPTDRNATILNEIQSLEYWKTVGQETLSGARPLARRADGTECELETYTRWVDKADVIVPILRAALAPAGPPVPEPPPADQLTTRAIQLLDHINQQDATVETLTEHLDHLNGLILALLAEGRAAAAWRENEGSQTGGPFYCAWHYAQHVLWSHAKCYENAHPR